MIRLIYTSTQRAALSAHELHVLCVKAAENNRRRGLSGILLYNGYEFMQCLEGERNDLATVYEAIIQDPRHTDIQVLKSISIDQRLFSGWSMSGFLVSMDRNGGLDSTAYSFLDQRLYRPWKLLGQAGVDLITEYAQVKAELEKSGMVKSLDLI